jgi:hypothetical protein
MNGLTQGLGTIAFVALGWAQLVAELDGLRQVFEWPPFVCWLIAMFTAWIPLVGSIGGAWGAHVAWSWGWPSSLALFLAFPVMVLPLVALAIRRRRAALTV